jgi:hypothetical protein
MRLWCLGIAALLLMASPVAAQNLCDATPPSNPQLSNPFDVAFGWDGKDGDGNVVDPATVQVRVTIDGAARPLVALPAPVGTPTASGCRWYVLPNFTLSKGSHTVTATLVTADGEGTAPPPFAFGIKGKPPSTVQKVQATQ